MNESARITQKILLSVLAKHNNVSSIRRNTGLHQKTLSDYLERLARQGLIEVETEDWRRGKSKLCRVTNAGIKWLTDTSLNETLHVLSKIVCELRNSETREALKETMDERFSRNRKLVQDHFIDRFLKGDKSPLKYPEGFEFGDVYEPLREALKKLFALQLYLTPQIGEGPEEDPEVVIEKEFILFAPNMTFVFSWDRSKIKKLDSSRQQIWNNFEYWLQQVNNDLKRESAKLRMENKRVLKETHLLGLDRVDERVYDEYLRATDEASRQRILAKIEDEVGWSVGKYLGRLLIGREEEIAKYIDELQQPSLTRFISLFRNRGDE